LNSVCREKFERGSITPCNKIARAAIPPRYKCNLERKPKKAN
jgi:hypothetical protein